MSPPARDITHPLRLVAAVVGVFLVLVAALAWINRRTLAREALTDWLQAKGVASEVEVEAVGPTSFVARLRLGDPARPDFVAERVDVRYRIGFRGLEIGSVILTKPVLRAELRQGRLRLGSLDPLVDEFLSRPPRPDAAMPRVRIEDGVVALATEYGPVRLTADALVEDGKLMRLSATSAPLRLRSPAFDVALGAGSLQAATRGDRVDVRLNAPVARAAAGQAVVEDGRLSLTAQLPYPDLQRRRGDGAVVARAGLTAQRMTAAGQALEDASLAAALTGTASGWIPDLAVSGPVTASLRARSATFGAAQADALRVAATSQDLRWTRKGGDRVAGTLNLTTDMDALSVGDLRLTAFAAAAAGPVMVQPSGAEATLTGSVVGRGAWRGLGPPAAGESGEIAAVKRAARGFRIAAPELVLAFRDGGVAVALEEPARLVPDRGGAVTVAPRGEAPLYGPDGGALRLTVSGGGLPRLEADVSRLNATAGDVTAQARLRVQGSVGPVRGGAVDAAGLLRLGGGGVSFVASRCVTVEAERLDFGANAVEDLSGRLCPAGGPMIGASGGGWRFAGRAEDVRAAAPFLQVRIEGGAGPVAARGRGDRMNAEAEIAAARLVDLAPETRFQPLRMTGDVALADQTWRADLAFRRPAGPQVGTARLTHEAHSGRGGVAIDTGLLTFAAGGLQPADLSPLAASVGSPAEGQARFTGRVDWTPDGVASDGLLAIPRLSFESPAGAVQGLSGEVEFASLSPLVAAAGQELRIELVDAVVPLTKLRATFALADQLLQVEGGEAEVGGGRVRVETLEIPLTPGAPIRGVLHLEGVQLHDLVEVSPFGDKVEFDAKVSGRVPFEARGSRIRVSGGELEAVQPGRISIDRSALTGVKADGAIEGPVEPVDPNATFTDFAYQAMENLAFDKLEASIMSKDDGRLGVLFHITGRHDPPTKQTLKLSLMDLIQRRFLGRKLPLPSGTGVNLTLDTTLNLDDLLADYGEYLRARSSGPVQP